MTIPFLLNGERVILPRDACDLLSEDQFLFHPNTACPILTSVVLVPCLAQYLGSVCTLRWFSDEEWNSVEDGEFQATDGDSFRNPGVVIYTITDDHETTTCDFLACDLNQIRLLRKTRNYPIPKTALRELNEWSSGFSLFQVKTALPSGYFTIDTEIDSSATPITLASFRRLSFVHGDVRLLLLDSYGVCLATVPYEEIESIIATELYQAVSETYPSRSTYLRSEPDKQFIWRFNGSISSTLGQGPFCLDIDHELLDGSTLDLTVVSDVLMIGRPLPTSDSGSYMCITVNELKTDEWTVRVWYVRALRQETLNVSFDFNMTEDSYTNGAFVVCCLGRVDGRSVIALISYDPAGYSETLPFDRNLVVSKTVDKASTAGSTEGADDESGEMNLSGNDESTDPTDVWESSPSTFEERVTRLPFLGKLMCFTLLLVATLGLIKLISQFLKRKKNEYLRSNHEYSQRLSW